VNNAQNLHQFIASDYSSLNWPLLAAHQSKSQDAEVALLKHSVTKRNLSYPP
jgi:hypothetical protein